MKVVSQDVVHKSDVGGVVLNVQSEQAVLTEYESMIKRVKEKMPEAIIKGILVGEMIPPGQEVILGLKRDATFGPVIMLGLGGIFVEILKDVTFGITPVGPDQADRMIEGLKASALLKGARGRAPADLDALRECIRRLSQLADDCPQISELDINPLIVLDKGSIAADARIIL